MGNKTVKIVVLWLIISYNCTEIKHIRRIEIFLAIQKEDKNSSTNWWGHIDYFSNCFYSTTNIRLPVRNDFIQKNRNSKRKWECFRIKVSLNIKTLRRCNDFIFIIGLLFEITIWLIETFINNIRVWYQRVS